MLCSLTNPVRPRREASEQAVAMSQPAKFDEPTYTTFPCCTSASNACQVSSQGQSRSTWCIW
jgi:hypothetical protein